MTDDVVMLNSNFQLYLCLSGIVLTTCICPNVAQGCCFLHMHAIAAVQRDLALKSEFLAKAAMSQWLAITKRPGLLIALP